ncbi:hypothetical protein, partial [Paracidovorax avenae]|uniref:hypothetical protein n=1 Tax=Paracidovorax avenae TaxID=80867 RepID=UPI001864E763
SLEDLERDVALALSLQPPHLSIYHLITATIGAEQHALPLQCGFREQARQGALRRERRIDG